jgi:limonene-1,2-epoxide hydrolase
VDQKEVVRDALAALDTSADAFIEHLTEDAEFLTPFGELHGREEIRQFVAGMYASFSEWKHDVTIQPGGDVVVIEGTWNGTHSGAMQTPQGEIPATGIRASVPFAGIVRVQGDRLASIHNYFDTSAMMGQLAQAAEKAPA